MTTKELWEKYKTADVSANELKFFRYIEDNVDNRGIFNKKNVDIAKEFNVGDRTISRWVDALEKAELITSFQNRRQHIRNIRICYAKKKVKLPDYAEMTPAQKLFQDAFPGRVVNADVPDDVDMPGLIKKIKASKYLQNYTFTSLRWFLDNYKKIMAGGFDNDGDLLTKMSSGRDYSEEALNSSLLDPTTNPEV